MFINGYGNQKMTLKILPPVRNNPDSRKVVFYNWGHDAGTQTRSFRALFGSTEARNL